METPAHGPASAAQILQTRKPASTAHPNPPRRHTEKRQAFLHGLDPQRKSAAPTEVAYSSSSNSAFASFRSAVSKTFHEPGIISHFPSYPAAALHGTNLNLFGSKSTWAALYFVQFGAALQGRISISPDAMPEPEPGAKVWPSNMRLEPWSVRLKLSFAAGPPSTASTLNR